MFTPPQAGDSAESQHIVTDADTAHAWNNANIASLASPRLLHWIENTTSLLWQGHRDETEEALLGLHFEFNHLAPSPVGATVHVRVTVAEVDRRRVTYQFEAWDEHGRICDGVSETFLLPMEKYQARLAARARG